MSTARATVPQTTPGAVYTSVGETALVNVYFCNHTGSAVTIDVYVVPSGGSADNTNIIYKTLDIVATDTYVMDQEKLVLGDGESIQASCSASDSVAVTVSYLTVA